MLPIVDLKVDAADDIIISGDDVLVSTSILQSNMDVAARRIVGRYDENLYRNNLCAGLERFLFSKNIKNSIYDIKAAIVNSLTRDNLFFAGDFDVKVGLSDDPREAKLYVIFKTNSSDPASTFKIFVDVENQRVYRGK